MSTANFLGRFTFDITQPLQAISELEQRARQASQATPMTTRQLAEVQARGQSELYAGHASGQLPNGSTGLLASLRALEQSIQRLATQTGVSKPGPNQVAAAANRLGYDPAGFTATQTVGGLTPNQQQQAELARLHGLALAEQRAQDPSGLTQAQRARIAALQNARPDNVRAGTRGAGGKSADDQVRQLTALYRQIPEAIRERLGLDIAEMRNAVRIAHSIRRGGPAADALKLAGTANAYNTEIGLRRQVADERALADLDGRRTSRVATPGPFSKLVAENEVLQRRRQVAEQTALEQALASESALTKATVELAVLRESRAAREKIAIAEAGRAAGLPTLQAQAQVAGEVSKSDQQTARLAQLQQQATSPFGTPLVDAKGNPLTQGQQIGLGRADDARSRSMIEASTQLSLETDKEYIQATAQAAASRRRIALQVATEERAILLNSATGQERGTWFQRMQARIAQRGEGGSVKLPVEYQTGGQFLKSRFATTAGFALSGALLYGGVTAVKELVREASELQVELGLVKSQFDGAGISAARFGEFRSTLIGISKESGVAADELAKLSRNLLGVFRLKNSEGKDVGPDVSRVEKELAVAAKFSQITGVATKQIKDDMVAVVSSFQNAGQEIDFGQLSDQLVGLENRTGVAAGELLNFTGTLAPLGAELGFTARQLAALGAVASQVSAKPASTLAENIGRVLTTLSDKSGQAQQKLVQFYASTPALAGNLDKLAANLQSGNISKVVQQLLEDYNKLDNTQKSKLTEVFGKREAQSFVALLNNADVALRELNRSGSEDKGAFEARWKTHAATVTFAFAQMKRAAEELGITLFEAGLSDALKIVAVAAGTLVKAVAEILKVFVFLNNVTDGGVGRLIAVAVAIRTVTAAVKALRTTQLGEAVAATINGAAAAPAVTAGTMTGNPIGFAVPGAAAATTTRAGAAAGRIAGGLGASEATAGTLAAAGGYGLAATLAPLAILTAGTYAFTTVQGRMKKAADAAEKFGTSLEKLSDKDLAKVQRGESVSGVGTYTGGTFGTDRDTVVERERLRRQSERYTKAARVGFEEIADKSGLKVTPENRTAIKDEAERRRKEINDTLDRQIRSVKGGPGTDIQKSKRYADLADAASRQEEVIDRAEKIISSPAELDKALHTLKDITKGGRKGAAARANQAALEAAIALLPEGPRQIAQEALRQAGLVQKNNQAAEEAAANLQGSQGNFELTVALYKKGERTSAQVRSAYEYDIRQYTALAKDARAKGQIDEEAEQKLIESRAAFEQYRDELFKGQADRLKAVSDITGQDTTLAQTAQALEAIRDPNTSLDGDIAAAQQIAALTKEATKKRYENARSYAEGLKILDESMTLSPELKQVLVRIALDSPAARESTTKYLASIMPKVDPNLRLSKFATEYANADEAGRKVMVDAIKAQRDHLTQMLAIVGTGDFLGMDAPQIKTAIAGLNRVLGALNVADQQIKASQNQSAYEGWTNFSEKQKDLLSSMTKDPKKLAEIAIKTARTNLEVARRLKVDTRDAEIALNEALQQGIEADQAIADAQTAIATARAGGDPLAQAQAGLAGAIRSKANAVGEAAQGNAEAEIINAQRQLDDAVKDIASARLELATAMTEGDALATARAQMAEAQHNLSTAQGEAARIRATAELFKAQRALAAAALDQSLSWLELASAMSTAGGDTVGAANYNLAIAQRQLQEARAHGGTAEINRAYANVVSQQAALRDAQLADREGDIDFALQMEKITTSQAIRQLQALLKIPGLTEAQIRELQLKIKQMTDELGADYQYNMPNFLGVPTLYTGRRVNEMGGPGGYQDNRRFDVRVYASPGMDTEEVANKVVAKVGDGIAAPPTSSSRRY